MLISRMCKQEHQYDKENVDRAWAEIGQAREAAREAAKKEEEAKTEKERRVRIDVLVEESKWVAKNIAKAEKAIEEEEECEKEKVKEAGGSIDYEKEVEDLDWVFP